MLVGPSRAVIRMLGVLCQHDRVLIGACEQSRMMCLDCGTGMENCRRILFSVE